MRTALKVLPEDLPAEFLLAPGVSDSPALDAAVERAVALRRERRLRFAAMAEQNEGLLGDAHDAIYGVYFRILPLEDLTVSTQPDLPPGFGYVRQFRPEATMRLLLDAEKVFPPKLDLLIARHFSPHPDEAVLDVAAREQDCWRAPAPTPQPPRRFLSSPKDSVRPLLDEFFRRHPEASLADDTRTEDVSLLQPGWSPR